MNNDKTIGIIGSGLGGLVSACTLAARGYKVTLFEKNSWIGGKAAVLESDGYRFDMGPTILTLPGVLEKVFNEAGLKMEDELELLRLDPQWRCFFDDQTILDLVEDPKEMSRKIQSFGEFELDQQGYLDFIKLSEQLHDISDRFFFWKSVQDLRDTIDLKKNMDLETLKDVWALRMGQSVAGTLRKNIKDKKVAQMLDHFVQYVGSSPINTPAVLCSIAHMQTNKGVWYPKGGTRAVPKALQKLAEKLDVKILLNTGIFKINTNKGKTTGITTESGQEFKFSAIVSNMDSLRTYQELLVNQSVPKFKWSRTEPACSGVVLYLGLNKAYDHLLHHNFVFSDNPEQEFDYIYKKGEPAPDPTCYLAAPSCTEKNVAPASGEALYILVHTPYLREHHDWKKMLPEYRKVIFEKLARCAGMEDLEQRIVFEECLTPEEIDQRYNVLKGAIYGLASHGKFFGAFKPGNRSRTVKGLYLAGGSAHPGPGMPMASMSGWIAADSLDQDIKAGIL